MQPRTRLLLATAILLCTAPGCVHDRLQVHSVRQIKTLPTILEQQVLDNLAMIVANRGNTPFLAIPTAGGTSAGQTNSGTGNLAWNPTTLTGVGAGVNGTINLTENFTMTPVTDPDRLALMKGAYQYSVGVLPVQSTDNLFYRLTNFFDGGLGTEVPQRFFSVCNSAPRGDECSVKYGEYCGTYVVVPCEYFDLLSRLTLSILDIAEVSDTALARRQMTEEERAANAPIMFTSSFIAVVGGRPQVVTAERELPFSEFQSLATAGLTNTVPGSTSGIATPVTVSPEVWRHLGEEAQRNTLKRVDEIDLKPDTKRGLRSRRSLGGVSGLQSSQQILNSQINSQLGTATVP